MNIYYLKILFIVSRWAICINQEPCSSTSWHLLGFPTETSRVLIPPPVVTIKETCKMMLLYVVPLCVTCMWFGRPMHIREVVHLEVLTRMLLRHLQTYIQSYTCNAHFDPLHMPPWDISTQELDKYTQDCPWPQHAKFLTVPNPSV